MADTSAIELADRLAGHCMRDREYPETLARTLIGRAAADPEASSAFFARVVERLADAFEPALCDVYARLFASAVESVEPELRAGDLVERYRRVRIPRRCEIDPVDVFVLSRVTLGADIAVTSVVIDAALRRFPRANLWFVGPRKNWNLLAGHPRVDRLVLDYPRTGTLGERIAVWRKLRAFFAGAGGIVLDTDSRLTQLGMLPVCDEERYFFFESRAYGGDGGASLGQLARRWAGEVLGVDDARAFVAPAQSSAERPDLAISFGVGGNDAKRIPDPFERRLLEALPSRRVLIDKGAPGSDEAERVSRAMAGLGHVRAWEGDFAPFAAAIVQAGAYVGYDSAGQHVAAAAGVPLVSVFAGHTSERFAERWRPSGRGRIEMVRVAADESVTSVLERTLAAVERVSDMR